MTRRTSSGRPLHWDSYLLIVVAIVCAFALTSVDKTGSSTSRSTYSSTIPGLDGPTMEASARRVLPSATTDPIVSSGRRSLFFTEYRQVDGRSRRSSIEIDSQVAGGAVNSVSCTVDSIPSAPLTVRTNPVLAFCANLPIRGAASDTSGWLDAQYATAQVGYSHRENHGGASYDLTFSQFGNETITYDIYVRPAS